MGELIHAAGHGLSADDIIMLGNLVGGEGLEENVSYYVLADGLTADDFKISDSSGGTPIVYTTDIEDGVIVTTDVYEAAADGVMDPPDTPAAPAEPTLGSAEVSGIVRLTITLAITDEAQVRSYELAVTHKYDDGAAEWDYAGGIIFTLPVGTADWSMPALPGTNYAVKMRKQDVYGNFSDYCAEQTVTTVEGNDALNSALAAISNGVSGQVIDWDNLVDDAVRENHIQAGSVTANALAATLILTSLIYAGDPNGRHVEIDEFGVRLVDGEELIVNIPTDADTPVYFKGDVVAESFSSTNSNDISGEVDVTGDAVVTVANGVSAPTVAPSLSQAMGSLALSTTPSGVSTAAGVWYDPTTTSYWIAADPDSGYIAHEYDSDGTFLRSIEATGSTSTVTDTVGSTSHVSDGALGFAASTTDNQFSSPLTMPRDGRITKISVYCAGRLGSVSLRNAVWSSGGGSLLRQSAWYTAASGGATAAGASDKHNISVSPLSVSGGTTYRVGFFKADGDSDGVQLDYDSGSGKTLYIGDNGQDAYSGGTTHTSKKLNVYVTYEYDVDTRLETLPNIGVATTATHLFLLDTGATLWKYDLTTGVYESLTDLSADITGDPENAGLFYDATAGELIVTTATGTGAGVYPKFVRVNPSTLAVSGAYSASAGTTFTGSTDTFRGGARLADPLNSDAATYWVCTTGGVVYAYTFTGSTATQTANRHFGTTSYSGSGVCHNGTEFRGWYAAAPTRLVRFTGWDFTTTSTKLWVGYAWYDSAGTTHETAMGPRSSVTIRRRERVIVGTPSIPTGGADDPDNVRIYFLQNATDSGAGAFWLQATHATTSATIETYTGSGTHDGAGTAFPAGSPATITSSASPGWTLSGDGTAEFEDIDVNGLNAVRVPTALPVFKGATADNNNIGTSVADTTGATVSFTSDVAETIVVQAQWDVVTSATGSTSTTGYCYLDGSEVTTGANARFRSNLASDRNTMSGMWVFDVAAGAHTVKLRHQKSASAATIDIVADETGFIMTRYRKT